MAKNDTPMGQAADALQRALAEDARVCLEAGLSPEQWRRRVHLLLHYSLPAAHVEHRQDARGNWFHRILP